MTEVASWPPGAPTGAHVVQGDVALSYADRTVRLPRLWLRSNCPCPACHHPGTGERAVFVADEPANVAVVQVGLRDEGMDVVWNTGHTAHYPFSWFAQIQANARVWNWEHDLWDSTHQPHRVDHHQLLEDMPVRREAFSRLQRDGVIIVTDVPTEPGEVARFLKRLGVPLRSTPFDDVHDVFFDPAGYNIAHTTHAVPPHNDFASYTWPPSGQLLHFLANDATGGESILVDGFAAIERLEAERPGSVEVLARTRIGFREFSAAHESFTRAPIVRLDERGRVAGIRFSNQLMQPLPPDTDQLELFYETYHHLGRILTDPQQQIVFHSRAGDMQMVHGHRLLHGRTAFDLSSGRRHLQDTYFEMDDVLSLLARMSGDLVA